MAEGRINKVTELQETKFLLLVLQMCITSEYMPKCNCLCLCVQQHQHYALLT